MSAFTSGHRLLANSVNAAFRCILWFACGGDFRDGWVRWEERVGMDFYSGACATIARNFRGSRGLVGRALHRRRRRCIILGGASYTSASILAYTRGERVSLRADTSVYIVGKLNAPSSALTRRFELDRPAINTQANFTPKEILRSLRSPQVIIMFIKAFLGGTILYGLALFLPSIVRQLGFNPLSSQLLSVGPFAVAFVGMLIFREITSRLPLHMLTVITKCLLS